mmetsp:Transcript_19629/g.63760  ORF Transcript_19629/g.63760 Transcript_19629/m.63760 type:complete len:238 (-) Transcript_19629:1603-2316(-)
MCRSWSKPTAVQPCGVRARRSSWTGSTTTETDPKASTWSPSCITPGRGMRSTPCSSAKRSRSSRSESCCVAYGLYSRAGAAAGGGGCCGGGAVAKMGSCGAAPESAWFIISSAAVKCRRMRSCAWRSALKRFFQPRYHADTSSKFGSARSHVWSVWCHFGKKCASRSAKRRCGGWSSFSHAMTRWNGSSCCCAGLMTSCCRASVSCGRMHRRRRSSHSRSPKTPRHGESTMRAVSSS